MENKEVQALVEAYLKVYDPQEVDEGHGSRRSFGQQSKDERWRVNTFNRPGSKVEYTPHRNWDPEANRGQGQILRPNQAEKQRRKKLAKAAMGEELDIFDVVLEFLYVEGYVETLEEAEWMMSNVIDEEAIDIILGEAEVEKSPYHHPKTGKMMTYGERQKQLKDKAEKIRSSRNEEYVDESQRARENPEGHDREERRKYEPVRGERTPMPPRGDKRREDFERWYRANVR